MNITFVTAADASHQKSLINLLQSIVDRFPHSRIKVWDLGLDTYIKHLIKSKFSNPNVLFFSYDFARFDRVFAMNNNSGSYAWKAQCICDSVDEDSDYIVWMDAGNIVFPSLWLGLVLARFSGVFVCRSHGNILSWTHNITLEALKIKGIYNESLATYRNCSAAGILFFMANPKALSIISSWQTLSSLPSIICPPGSSKLNHRYDQAILSILLASLRLSPLFSNKLSFIFGFATHRDIDE